MYVRTDNKNRIIADNQLVGEREHLYKKRIISVTGELNEGGMLSGGVCGTALSDLLISMDSINHDPIKLLISSPGGVLDSAFVIYDTIKIIKSPVYTLGRYAASAAVMLLAAGQKRYVSVHGRVMIHLPFADISGDEEKLVRRSREVTKYKDQMAEVLIECGATKSKRQIMLDMRSESWLNPEETVAYGIADGIMDGKMLEEWLK